jgi:hypothetical protein
MRGKLGNIRVTQLWYTADDGTRVQCSTQIDMERACFLENESRFSQTEDTPPMMEPTLSKLGWLGDTEAVEQILLGHYVSPPGTDKYMIELLNELRMPANILHSLERSGTIPTSISPAENKSA